VECGRLVYPGGEGEYGGWRFCKIACNFPELRSPCMERAQKGGPFRVPETCEVSREDLYEKLEKVVEQRLVGPLILVSIVILEFQ